MATQIQRVTPDVVDVFVTHINCPDGTACVFAFYYYCNYYGLDVTKVIFKPFSYDMEVCLKDFQKKNVLICDFSFKKDVYAAIKKVANAVLTIDHHKTANEELNGDPTLIYDEKECGATLLWKWLWTNSSGELWKPLPRILEHIRDRDLWQFKLPQTKAILFYMHYEVHGMEDWMHFFYERSPAELHAILEDFAFYGNWMLVPVDKTVKSIAYATARGNFFGHLCAIVNTSHFVSEVADYILQTTQDVKVVLVWRTNVTLTQYRISMRARASDPEIDVGELCKKYFGGGGHRAAAGFTVEVEKFPNIRSLFQWIGQQPLKQTIPKKN